MLYPVQSQARRGEAVREGVTEVVVLPVADGSLPGSALGTQEAERVVAEVAVLRALRDDRELVEHVVLIARLFVRVVDDWLLYRDDAAQGIAPGHRRRRAAVNRDGHALQ